MAVQVTRAATPSAPPSSKEILAGQRTKEAARIAEANEASKIAGDVLRNASSSGALNERAVAESLLKIAETKPELAEKVRAEILKKISPVEQGNVLRSEQKIVEAKFKDASPEQQKQLLDRMSKAPANSAERKLYDRLSNVWGKNHETIQKGYEKLTGKGLTLEYAEKQVEHLNSIKEKIAKENEEVKDALFDLAQIGLDITGIFDPTPILDGANGVISLFRGDLKGAIISAISIVPGAGDSAKIAKIQNWSETLDKVLRLISTNTRAGELLKPALKLIANALEKISPELMSKLPEPLQKFIQKTLNNLKNADFRDAAGDGVSAGVATNNLMNTSRDADLHKQLEVLSQQILSDFGVADTPRETTTPPTGTTTSAPPSSLQK
jgi:hypothetical protein